MNSKIEEFFSQHVSALCEKLAALDRRLDSHDEPTDDAALAELTDVINDSLRHCAELELHLADDPQLLKQTQAGYREAIWPWFGKSWFMNRSFSKPRGYPGDYELLHAIYNRLPKSRGLGGYLDRYVIDAPLGLAVSSRLAGVRKFLTEEVARRDGKAKILNVACGSGREYLGGFLASEASEVDIACVDNDPASMEFVQANVVPQLPPQVKMQFVRYNALRMVSGKNNVEKFGRSDIIYSVGLCDYIPDDYLVPMLRGWRESLAEGGVVYVAFKDMELYDKTVYQWLTDWYFYQRTTEECRNLFVEAGYDMEEMEVTRCSMPVIINFIGRTKSGRTVRIDGAETLVAPHAEVEVREESEVSGS